jgi:hypothetical protein
MITNQEVIDYVLEGFGLNTESYLNDAKLSYGNDFTLDDIKINLELAREWIKKSNEAEAVLREYTIESLRIYELRKKITAIREPLLKQYFKKEITGDEIDANPELQDILRQEKELSPIVSAKYWEFCKACDLAREASKGVVTYPKPQSLKKSKPPKDYQHLVDYWDKKLDGVIYKLNRARGALEKAQAAYESASNAGSELGKYFPVGVGGSGKPVRQLNKRKEQQGDRLIESMKRRDEAKKRVSALELTFERYQNNYQKALDGLEKQQQSNKSQVKE